MPSDFVCALAVEEWQGECLKIVSLCRFEEQNWHTLGPESSTVIFMSLSVSSCARRLSSVSLTATENTTLSTRYHSS